MSGYNSPTKDWTCDPGFGSIASWPWDYRGSLWEYFSISLLCSELTSYSTPESEVFSLNILGLQKKDNWKRLSRDLETYGSPMYPQSCLGPQSYICPVGSSPPCSWLTSLVMMRKVGRWLLPGALSIHHTLGSKRSLLGPWPAPGSPFPWKRQEASKVPRAAELPPVHRRLVQMSRYLKRTLQPDFKDLPHL